ncbi:MAG: hypothetical protein JSW61_02255 [Candidatus Thorarchaeota archaeon]|nr:MAG: hypothetical protein JSW61_02255 [Candidatus Thorarchaeota archaeon]
MVREILILAGGGGHTGYAYALAQALSGKASLSSLVPEGDTLSEKRMSRFCKVDFLPKPRGPKTPGHEFAVRLAEAFARSLKKVPRRTAALVSSGSNFCIPPAFAAWLKGIAVINIESSIRFTIASKTARILQPLSTITALQWVEQKKLLKHGVVVGPLLPKSDAQPRDGGYVLVTGGTYGHRLLFDVIAQSHLDNVVLQTGRIDTRPYIEKHPEWQVISASDRFSELVAGADVVVTHFGSTVLEALSLGKPTVVVLNPEWTRTVGAEDAKHLADKVNAVLVTEISLEVILDAIDEARRREIPILSDGAKELADVILET